MKRALRKHRAAKRAVAGREDILGAARSSGIRLGWKAVTIRAVAQKLGYTSPLLYEHFRDKEELLTELASEGQVSLADALVKELPDDPYRAVLSMVDRYWSFMLENEQVYRLMNGMDGVPIDRDRLTAVAQHSFEAATAIVQGWLTTAHGSDSGAALLFEDLWAGPGRHGRTLPRSFRTLRSVPSTGLRRKTADRDSEGASRPNPRGWISNGRCRRIRGRHQDCY